MYVKIIIDDGNGKKAELELSNVDQTNQAVIIQSVFELFNLDTSFLEKEQKMSKIEKAYAKFFDEVDPIENRKKEIDTVEIEEKFADTFETKNAQEILTTYQTKDDNVPEHIITGIKFRDGIKLYRLKYKCPVCGLKNTHYVYPNAKITWCHRCEHDMVVYPAAKKHLERDTLGNFFRAGEFMDWNIHG